MADYPTRESPKSDLSPSSGYLLYGNGSREDYEREVRRVKAQLAIDLYGPVEEDDKKRHGAKKADARPRPQQKKNNAAAIIALLMTIISVVVAALYVVLPLVGVEVGKEEIVTTLKAFLSDLNEIRFDVAFGKTVCVLATILFVVTTLIGASCSVKRPRVGKLMLTGTVLWTAALAALAILIGVSESALSIETVILTVLAAVALLAVAVGGKKTGGK